MLTRKRSALVAYAALVGILVCLECLAGDAGSDTRLLIALLLVMTVVVLTAHLVLKRQLRPLRDLSEVCSVYRFNRCFTGACLVPQSASCAATFGG